MPVQHIPPGYHTVTPYFIVEDASAFIDFIVRAFGAAVKFKSVRPDGKVSHADCMIGDSHVLVGQMPPGRTPTAMMVYLYVEDCDALYRRAIEAGALSTQEPADQFYGDRNAGVTDPYGNLWWIGTHIEDVPDAELDRRMREHYS